MSLSTDPRHHVDLAELGPLHGPPVPAPSRPAGSAVQLHKDLAMIAATSPSRRGNSRRTMLIMALVGLIVFGLIAVAITRMLASAATDPDGGGSTSEASTEIATVDFSFEIAGDPLNQPLLDPPPGYTGQSWITTDAGATITVVELVGAEGLTDDAFAAMTAGELAGLLGGGDVTSDDTTDLDSHPARALTVDREGGRVHAVVALGGSNLVLVTGSQADSEARPAAMRQVLDTFRFTDAPS